MFFLYSLFIHFIFVVIFHFIFNAIKPFCSFAFSWLFVVLLCGYLNSIGAVDIECNFQLARFCLVKTAINVTDGDEVRILPVAEDQVVSRFSLTLPSQLGTVPKVIFDTFPVLEDLTLNAAGIKALSGDRFANAKILQNLLLNDNQIQVIRSETFVGATNLERLELTHNEIEEVEDHAMKGLANLRTLKLNNNRIKVLRSVALTGASSLEYLHIYSNELETIEDGALNLPNLIEAFFAYNKLKILADNLFVLAPKIEITDFSGNQLTHIGKAFYGCHRIYSLFLENNRIEDVNLTGFAGMAALTALSLNNTGFKLPEKVPTADTNGTKSILTRLNLSNNQLSTGNIFKHLAVFGELQEVYLDNNRFTHFHDTYQIKDMFPKLTHIELVNNDQICEWLQDNIEIFQRDEIRVTVGKPGVTSGEAKADCLGI